MVDHSQEDALLTPLSAGFSVAVMRSMVLIPPGLGHVFQSPHKVWVTVTLDHFCQGCVTCVRGPWIKWENPGFNSTFETDHLDFNKTKIEHIVGTQ